MTYNVGGGRKDFGSVWDSVIHTIRESEPDILLLQEVVEWQDVAGREYRAAHAIARTLGFGEGVFFGPTLSMRQNFHPKKSIFIHGIFQDYLDWRQGNALLSRWGFTRMGDPSAPGQPWNLPLFLPAQYEGSRDTDPRYAILSRVCQGETAPYVVGTHWSTLVGERGSSEKYIPGKIELAAEMRRQQAQRLLDILNEYPLAQNDLIFLAGDFNAAENEPCVAELLVARSGFTRLQPENTSTPTHLYKVAEPIDHIFVFPASRLLKAHCWIVDTPIARQASDHLPVVADVWVK